MCQLHSNPVIQNYNIRCNFSCCLKNRYIHSKQKPLNLNKSLMLILGKKKLLHSLLAENTKCKQKYFSLFQGKVCNVVGLLCLSPIITRFSLSMCKRLNVKKPLQPIPGKVQQCS